MSLKSWMEEFYRVPVEKVSKSQAPTHALKKWIGLLPDNLIKHEVFYSQDTHCLVDIDDADSLHINSSTCALCYHYFKDDEDGGGACYTCPLYKKLGRRCDASPDSINAAPYYQKSVIPMVTALSSLLK